MKRLMLWGYAHPLAALFCLGCGSLLSALQIPDLRIDTSAAGIIVRDDPAWDYYLETVDRFGTDNISVIYVRDPRLFSPKRLRALDGLVHEIEGLPWVEKVESIFSATDFSGTDTGLTTDPLVGELPQTDEEAAVIREAALRNPILRGSLVSPDGDVLAVNIFLAADTGDPDINATAAAMLQKLVDARSGNFAEIFLVGNASIKAALSENIVGDQVVLVPLATLVILVVLLAFMRSFGAVLLPLLTISFSILWTVGFMAWAGISLNILTLLVPALIVVIGSTEDMHILSEYFEGLVRGGGEPSAAFSWMVEKCATAVLLTAFSTFLGFLTISVNEILFLKYFAFAAAFGLFVNPLITVLIAPVYFRWSGPAPRPTGTRIGPQDLLLATLAEWVVRVVQRRRKWILGMFALFSVVLGVCATWVKLDNDQLGFFKESSSIRRHAASLARDLAGPQVFYIRLESGQDGAFRLPKNLKEIEKLQRYLADTGWFDKTVSLADYIKLIHREMNGGDPDFHKVPDSAELVAQYLLLLRADEVSRFVLGRSKGENEGASDEFAVFEEMAAYGMDEEPASEGYREATILVRHNISSSHELERVTTELKGFIGREIDPFLKIRFTGENILVSKATDSLAQGQFESLFLILSIIFVLIALLFFNIKAGLLSLVPNLFPILGLFGLMGLLGIPLNSGTALVAAMAVGVALDDTIHFMSRYAIQMRQLQDPQKAVEACIRQEMRPVFCTSLALALGFLVLCFASFVPSIHFALLSALVMVFAFLGDLFLTPILLASTQLITIWDLYRLDLHRDVIEKSQLFDRMSPRQIKKMVLLSRVQERGAGVAVVDAGDYGSSMFLLLEGSVEVSLPERNGRPAIVVAELGPGEVFGEIALVNPGPRSAQVRVQQPVKFLEIDWAGIERMRRLYPRLAGEVMYNLARILGRRLVETTRRVN